MERETVKCSSKSCGNRSFYPNQMTTVKTQGAEYELCPNCIKAINNTLGDRDTMGVMIKTTMPTAEFVRIRDERRVDAAHAIAGWPRRLMLPFSDGSEVAR